MPLRSRWPALVIGAGSAGLSASYHLKERGIEHEVLERSRVADSWASRRWDSFTLVTPNWSVMLPGRPYAGSDPDGYLRRDEVVAHLEGYARAFDLPVRAGVDVRHLRPMDSAGGWELDTSKGHLAAENVIVATGAFPEPRVLPSSSSLAPRVRQLHTSEYRNPGALPRGSALVVGSGQSGVQVAEDLLEAGREVLLAVGSCPRAPRRYRGKDIYSWILESGFMDMRLTDLPSPRMRLACNPQLTGRGGGHDLDVWGLARRGAALLGRFVRADGERVEFADDLELTLETSEKMTRKFLGDIDEYIARAGLDAPPAAQQAFDFALPEQPRRSFIDLGALGVSTVIWATGFRPSYPWIEGCAFDPDGFPVTDRGVTASPGLYFVGIHLLHTRRSGLLVGVGEDAEHVAGHVADRVRPLRR